MRQKASRISNTQPKANIAEVKRAAAAICEPDAVYELRSPKTKQGTVSGYFDNQAKLAEVAGSLSGNVPAVYLTLNPVKPDLMARASNRIANYAAYTTSDSDIIRRSNLLIDLDPNRPAGISSTETEKKSARVKLLGVIAWFETAGVRPSSMITADSGNGYHIIIRIDLENTPDMARLCQNVLAAVSAKFTDSAVTVDIATYNAARISKIYGTMACKGDSTPERPHRLSKLLTVPENIAPVPVAILESIAATLPPKEPPKPYSGGQSIVFPDWLTERGLAIKREKQTPEYTLYELSQCPWNPEHNHGEAWAQQFTSGAVAVGCHHNSCQGKGWQDLRKDRGNGNKPGEDTACDDAFTDYLFTDTRNAEYFTKLHGEKLRYDYRRARWLKWHNHYWREDRDNEILRLAVNAARRRYKDAMNISNLKLRERVSAEAIKNEQRARIDNCLAIAKALRPIAVTGEHWDADGWLLCVKNGVIDLRTGKLRDGKPEDLITQQAPVPYDAEAKAPRWLQFLIEVFNGDNELIAWLQRYLGYCLPGDTREQTVAIAYGRGANGKGRLLAIMEHVFGDYAYNSPFSTFELSQRAAIPNDLAALVGKRLVTSSETNEGTRINEARIKALTGQDSITARFLHAEFFTFQPVAKFLLAVNHRPRVHDDSYGFWRRVRLIPFNRQFKGEADDKLLLDKLKVEASGILNWLIEGCLIWQRQGLEPTPECVMRATEEYQSDSDPLSQFLIEKCATNPQAQVLAKSFYKSYTEWAEDQGYKDREILTNTAFGRKMSQKFKKVATRDGNLYHGVGLTCEGFVNSLGTDITNYNFFPNSLYAREDKPENPSQPFTTPNNPSQDSGALPPYPDTDCPKCGSADLMVTPDGKSYVCDKGHTYKGGK